MHSFGASTKSLRIAPISTSSKLGPLLWLFRGSALRTLSVLTDTIMGACVRLKEMAEVPMDGAHPSEKCALLTHTDQWMAEVPMG